jgi:hypothetical protein
MTKDLPTSGITTTLPTTRHHVIPNPLDCLPLLVSGGTQKLFLRPRI